MRAARERSIHHSRAFPRPARRRRGHSLCLLIFCLFPSVLAAQQAKPGPWDPYHAHKNVEVGRFYLKKGRYDAAISRFQEALRDQPDDAEAFLYLGEAYEMKGDAGRAIRNYQEYLRVWPEAKNAGKIRKRIEKLAKRNRSKGQGQELPAHSPSG